MGRLAHTGWAGVKRVRVDATDCPVARERLRKLKEVERLIAAGCGRLAAISSQGIGKSAYYEWRGRFGREGLRGLSPKSRRPRSHPGRQWTMQDAERIRRLRERHPWAGAAKLHVLHNREHPRLALAAVKRIVSWLLRRRRILRCDFAERGGPRRQRDFSGSHARRWDMRRDWHAAIQVDHMTLSGDGVTLKGFHAVAPGDRRFCGRMYSRANSGCAADFLRRLVGEWGADAVCRIQVDGGSEFMGEFERACMQLGIELLVLPARRPQWNGLVERINRTVRTECWNHYRGEWNCRAMNERMDECIRFYNNERPHHSLGMKTPAEAATMAGVSA